MIKFTTTAVITLLAVVPLLQAQTPTPASQDTQPRSVVPAIAVEEDYRLKSNDVISINVYQEPELACVERVAGDGSVSVPLIGRIKVIGKTPVEVANAINHEYKQGYLANPQTSVAVTEATKQYITLLGEVESPGTYPLPVSGRVSLLQAVGMAGGFTRLASLGKVTVKRTGEERAIKLDARRLAHGSGKQNFEVRPGDIITVGERLF